MDRERSADGKFLGPSTKSPIADYRPSKDAFDYQAHIDAALAYPPRDGSLDMIQRANLNMSEQQRLNTKLHQSTDDHYGGTTNEQIYSQWNQGISQKATMPDHHP